MLITPATCCYATLWKIILTIFKRIPMHFSESTIIRGLANISFFYQKYKFNVILMNDRLRNLQHILDAAIYIRLNC